MPAPFFAVWTLEYVFVSIFSGLQGSPYNLLCWCFHLHPLFVSVYIREGLNNFPFNIGPPPLLWRRLHIQCTVGAFLRHDLSYWSRQYPMISAISGHKTYRKQQNTLLYLKCVPCQVTRDFCANVLLVHSHRSGKICPN